MIFLIRKLLGKKSIFDHKSLSDYNQEFLIQQGKKQFEAIIRRGLQIPVSLVG